MLPSWYILSLKPKGKCDCKKLIHLSSVSCLFIYFFFKSSWWIWIIYNFFNQLNYNFTRWLTITFEMAIKKCVNFFRLFHFTKVLTKHSLKGSTSLSNIVHSTINFSSSYNINHIPYHHYWLWKIAYHLQMM